MMILKYSNIVTLENFWLQLPDVIVTSVVYFC